MGINGLWGVLGDGEVWHVADYAAKHFKDTRQPLRIAVDEATWRFTNLTDEQVERIREGEPAANPIEKTILWRILRLWRLNIQLLFVHDGMRKPGKSRHGGRGVGRVDQDCIKMLHKMFDKLKVPYHQAPGEAEAECAKLQRLGVVDAVWSDDGDSFMFGCNTLIKAHKVGGKRVDDHIRLYRADAIAEKRDFDANSLVLFALLAGGDYDTTGLRDCGPVNAAKVCRRSFGLAKRIVNIDPRQLPIWRHDLEQALQKQVPPHFPNMKVLDGYRKPAVSTDEQCLHLRGLRRGWTPDIDQRKLRVELRQHYNFTTREYLKHLGPVFLARKLADADSPFWREENLKYDVHLKSNRRTKDDKGNSVKCEVKIMYAAHELVDVDLSVQPADEDWTPFAAKNGTPYDPKHMIECEMLECLLQNGLPESSWDPPVKEKKGKAKTTHGEESDVEVTAGNRGPVLGSDDAPIQQPSKKRGRPPSKQAETQPAKKKRKSKAADVESPSPPPPTFRHLDFPDLKPRATVVDLLDDDEDDEHTSQPFSTVSAPQMNKAPLAKGPPKFRPLSPKRGMKDGQKAAAHSVPSSKAPPAPAKRKSISQRPAPPAISQRAQVADTRPTSLPPQKVPVPVAAQSTSASMSSKQPHSPPVELVPGQAIDPRTLRELRVAALQNRAASVLPLSRPTQPETKSVKPALVIDLT